MNPNDCASPLQQFRQTVERAIDSFPQNRVCQLVDREAFELSDYHKVLRMIFHQVREGSFSFAMAAVNCAPNLRNAKEYLLHHADEEKLHWRWILNDLEKTGDVVDAVESSLPQPACQNYISFNYYVALKMPIARLAIATVLEGIGARYGGKYASKICKLLALTREQTQFYAGHGNTDREHIQDLFRVIEDCVLSEEEWQWMIYAAETAGRLYRGMYEEALAN